MSPLEYVLCAFFLLLLLSLVCGLFVGKIMRWCGRYDDQLSANWKPPEE
jgi:hypothetical protein